METPSGPLGSSCPTTLYLAQGIRDVLEADAKAKGISLSRLLRERVLAGAQEIQDLQKRLEATQAELETARKALDQAQSLLLHYNRLLAHAPPPADASRGAAS